MRAAGLEVVADVLTSEACLIASKHSKHPEVVQLIKKRILGYMTALSFVMISYNIPKELLSEAVKITPGKKAPTVSALVCGEAVAVSALVSQAISSAVMDQLEALGATDILIFTIANSRM
mmetsp:Transcript_343/g.708  ORF Transcript_343/g.708 Transcript_343/m.708 type:complete len:120 (-) Transcript_343:106-465(-)